MAATNPARNRYTRFTVEEAYVINVNRRNYTVDVETRHSAKTVADVQCMSPYHHFANGEGIYFLPEVGAICYLAWPSDHTPPFVLGFIGAASVRESDDDTAIRSTSDGGSRTDTSFKSNRLDLNPGDIALTTRDENFIVLRRGGVLQIGATPIAQRIYIPIKNYVKDFAENYSMMTFAGDVSWTVEPSENDPGGDAPASYTFHMNQNAQDGKASVRVRHYPLNSPGGDEKTAWEVVIAPQNIDRDTGSYSGEVYTLLITNDGKKTELVGANREIRVRGDDKLNVDGKLEVTVGGDETHSVQGSLKLTSSQRAILGSSAQTLIGGDGASHPGVLGDVLVEILSALTLPVAGATAGPPSPAVIAQFQRLLSRKVLLE